MFKIYGILTINLLPIKKNIFKFLKEQKKNFKFLEITFKNEGKKKKTKNSHSKIMYVKLIKRNYLISKNDNNNILINSCTISKSNDVFQEIKKKEKTEVEKTQNYDKYNYSFLLR